MEINREMFEAWLFSQPRERIFDYIEGHPNDPTGCLLCNFFKMATSSRDFEVAAWTYDVGNVRNKSFPSWLRPLMEHIASLPGFEFTAGQAQDAYRRLFPESIEPSEPNLTGQSTDAADTSDKTDPFVAKAPCSSTPRI